MDSLFHNLGSLVEAGIIEKNHTITSGITIKKAIIALELLREAIIETKNYIKSNLPSMKDMLVPIEARRKSIDMTLIDALDYMVANRNQSLFIGDVEQELV